ncbi:PREDICTED: transmembrane protein 68-like, partial [Chlamydotis macqueenii]|uniref:transmembrane protein 68-like n=1 Tax=Chlamydotis macqueenii TaxID=187382 RepID=UPI0005297644
MTGTDQIPEEFWLVQMPAAMLIVPEVFLPGVLYPFSLFLHIYKRKDGLKGHYSNELWDRRQQVVTYLWNLLGKLWH